MPTLHRFLIAALLLAASSAQADITALLTQFEGEWTSSGDAFGMSAATSMRWETALGGRYVHLSYVINMQTAEGEPRSFEGVAYYQLGEGDVIEAFWADNSGDLHPIRARRIGDRLESYWGRTGGKQGRTYYALLEPNRMLVTDWIKTDDGWRQFNSNEFTRVLSDAD